MTVPRTGGEPNMATDYRASHLGKGEDYDRDLSRGDFDEYMTQQESRILREIVSKNYPDRIGRYLDFACGTGRVTSQLEKHADKSFGVDVSDSMVSQARTKCEATKFYVQDITAAALGIEQVDLISAFRFFGNAQDDLRVAVLKSLRQLLKDDGVLVFNNHRNPSSIRGVLQRTTGRYEDHAADLSWNKLTCLLDKTGFAVDRCYGIAWWLVMHKLNKPSVFQSSPARWLEPLSRSDMIASRCPAFVCLARKK